MVPGWDGPYEKEIKEERRVDRVRMSKKSSIYVLTKESFKKSLESPTQRREKKKKPCVLC